MIRSRLACLLAALLAAAPLPAMAQTPVAVELVLAVDCSFSVNDIEYRLQMRGIAEAFRDAEVVRLVEGQPDGIAVTLFHWAGTTNNMQPVPWRHLRSEPDLLAFATEIAAAPRSSLGHYTGIGHAIAYGVRLIEENAFEGRRKKIDVSGDGRNNSGPEPDLARLQAFANGITINGLAVMTDDPDLARYYSERVVIGPSAFVIKALSYDDFAAAMKRKLLRELAPQVAEEERPDLPALALRATERP